MTRAATRMARGVVNEQLPSTNVVLVRGRLVGEPVRRIVGHGRRVASFDLMSLVDGRRRVVPVVAGEPGLPAMAPGDAVTVLGFVQRRFYREGSRTRGVTEVVARRVVVGGRSAALEKVYVALAEAAHEARNSQLPDA